MSRKSSSDRTLRWRIGQIASLAGVTPRAVRLYETAGIIERPRRTDAGYRHYGPADLAALLRVRRLRGLGLGLREIREVISEEGAGRTDLATALEGLRRELRDQVEALQTAIEAIDNERAALAAGLRSSFEALGPSIGHAVATGSDREDMPLPNEARELLAALESDPRWPPLRASLAALRDSETVTEETLNRLAQALARVLPPGLAPDELADVGLPLMLLGRRFSPAQLAVLHRTAHVQRGRLG